MDLNQDDESIAMDVYIKNPHGLGQSPGTGWNGSGKNEFQLGFNKVKVLGLPGGGSVIYTSAENNTPIIKGVSPPEGMNKDLERRTGIDVFDQTQGEGMQLV